MEKEKQTEIVEKVNEQVDEQVDEQVNEQVNEKVGEETPANEQEQGLPDIVATLTQEYEKRLEEQKNGYEKQIAERDKIITQIISGGKANSKPNDKMQTVIDKINAKRTYKKW